MESNREEKGAQEMSQNQEITRFIKQVFAI